MAPHPLVGQLAPTISLPDASGATYNFAPADGNLPTALLFYPKSGSYGCTREICQFRDALVDKDVFKASQIRVIGISPDPVDKQKEFVEKQKLTFPILSDTSGEARKAYSVGKGLMGMVEYSRITFLIDGKGIVRDAIDTTINYSAHAKFVQKWLDKMAKEDKEAQPPAEGSAA